MARKGNTRNEWETIKSWCVCLQLSCTHFMVTRVNNETERSFVQGAFEMVVTISSDGYVRTSHPMDGEYQDDEDDDDDDDDVVAAAAVHS